MSGCHNLVKYLMFFINILFTIVGALIIIAGALGFVLTKNLSLDMKNPVVLSLIVVIVFGAIVFFISFSGCCGAIRETNCLLLTYSTCMLILAIAKIVIVVLLFKNKTNWKNEVTDFVNKPNIQLSNDTITMGELRLVEYLGHCCGSTGPDSYAILASLDEKLKNKVPFTCCSVGLKKPLNTFCDKKDAYKQGCSNDRTVDKLIDYVNITGYAVIGIVLFEVVGFFSAVYLTCSNKSHGGYYEYD